jgi:hypothetical protein
MTFVQVRSDSFEGAGGAIKKQLTSIMRGSRGSMAARSTEAAEQRGEEKRRSRIPDVYAHVTGARACLGLLQAMKDGQG